MRGVVIGLAVLAATFAPSAAGLADEVSLETLLFDPAAYEGEVTVRGELVGDYGVRSDGSVWSQLNDDPYADAPVLEGGSLQGGNIGIGVRLDEDMITNLGSPGGYRLHGPVVEITGTWRYHDPARGGESYLDAEVVHLVQQARPLREDPHWGVLVTGILLLGTAGVLWRMRRKDATPSG